jgi:hypothetical protein
LLGSGQVSSVDTGPKIPIPDAIMRSMQGSSYPDVFAAVRQRVAGLREERALEAGLVHQ